MKRKPKTLAQRLAIVENNHNRLCELVTQKLLWEICSHPMPPVRKSRKK
jgi:hypothetical protein